jgi:signal transduction histidine kinase
MRFWPKSLAGRLAALLVLTLVLAQIVTFALFAGERVSAFRSAFRDDLFVRLVTLVELLEESPPDLHERLVATASSPLFRIELAPEASVAPGATEATRLREELAAALDRRMEDVRIALWEPQRRNRRDEEDDDEWEERRHGALRWVTLSVRLDDRTWLNAAADRPRVPPLGRAFLASVLISAAAVATVGAFGVRWASTPLRRLARAADQLGRGESFAPLKETGPLETRQANVAFNRMRERLDRYVRDRTAMLAAIAHDLRTPITTLRLRAEFIEDEETKAKVLDTLAEMHAMTEAVLAFARGDAASEESRPTDIGALVESIVEDAAESGREVRFEESRQATLNVRPFALRRAIGNLIDNATFYGHRASVRVEPGAAQVAIVIDDDGPGIPEGELERVFDPFVRLEGSRSRATGGAGLGLAIARSVVRAHGGDVRLEDRLEGGLRATVSLPV